MATSPVNAVSMSQRGPDPGPDRMSPTSSSGGEEGRDSSASGADPLGKRSLRAQLDADLSRQILFLEGLVVTKKRDNQAVHLASLGEDSQTALAFLAGVVRHCGQGVQVLGASAVERADEGVCGRTCQ
ncbi:hypothetical protein CGRA01v4_13786 [Colletotrichum graminicola]|nr:hypothetical protein CGRA01v4_13786 [Colletotrichum graminicola]